VRRLEALDRAFLASLRKSDAGLAERFLAWRRDGLPRLEESELLMELAPRLAAFVARLFRIEGEHAALCERIRADEVIFQWKRKVVERKVVKARLRLPSSRRWTRRCSSRPIARRWTRCWPTRRSPADPERELAVITTRLLEAAEAGQEGRRPISMPCSPGRAPSRSTPRWPNGDVASLRSTFAQDRLRRARGPRAPAPRPARVLRGPAREAAQRDGFDLTDKRHSPRENLREAHYCLTCHERAKDSCSTGLKDKSGALLKNPLGWSWPAARWTRRSPR